MAEIDTHRHMVDDDDGETITTETEETTVETGTADETSSDDE